MIIEISKLCLMIIYLFYFFLLLLISLIYYFKVFIYVYLVIQRMEHYFQLQIYQKKEEKLKNHSILDMYILLFIID